MISTEHTPLIWLGDICSMHHKTLIYAKLEGENLTGSMKYRSALTMMSQCSFRMGSHGTVIESSSGNMGAALSYICKGRGLNCVIVADPKMSPFHRQAIYDNDGIIFDVSQVDDTGGWLKTRLAVVRASLEEHPNWYWPNQYESSLNPIAFKRLGTEIVTGLLDYGAFKVSRNIWIFAAVSTGGSISGVADQLKTVGLKTKVIAVDAEGSAIFGQVPKVRHLNGIGSSLKELPLLRRDLIDDTAFVSDEEAFSYCYKLREQGIYVGGSSGAVMAAIVRKSYLFATDDIVVGIFPDHGRIYEQTIYNQDWLNERGISIHAIH